MVGITSLIGSALAVIQAIFSYLGQRTLVQKGRLEKENASLKETIKRFQLARKTANCSVPDNDRDIVNKL